ncbi:hypothetical protein E2C01_012980 [Portunus trituberculatus]|uniref:Uncharacterized protein n=1 Tax=Portunus trituberculatus TaxID=210409 RepID=A0A5B7DF41_PORTR|nr:hypothetical protein [Portunus trituberculatus]
MEVMGNAGQVDYGKYTGYRGEEEPSLLDLVFTKKPEPPPIHYLTPLGCDHVILMLEMQEKDRIRYREDYKREKLNYARADFVKLRKFFADIKWRNIMKERTIQGKYEMFLQENSEGVKKYVSIYRVKKKSIDAWYNARCIEGKKAKDKAWKKFKRADK